MNIPFQSDEELEKLVIKYTKYQYSGVICTILNGFIYWNIHSSTFPIAIIVAAFFTTIISSSISFWIYGSMNKYDLTNEADLEKLNEVKNLSKIHLEVEDFRLKTIQLNRKFTINDYYNVIMSVEKTNTSDFYDTNDTKPKIVNLEEINPIKTNLNITKESHHDHSN